MDYINNQNLFTNGLYRFENCFYIRAAIACEEGMDPGERESGLILSTRKVAVVIELHEGNQVKGSQDERLYRSIQCMGISGNAAGGGRAGADVRSASV